MTGRPLLAAIGVTPPPVRGSRPKFLWGRGYYRFVDVSCKELLREMPGARQPPKGNEAQHVGVWSLARHWVMTLAGGLCAPKRQFRRGLAPPYLKDGCEKSRPAG